MNIKSRDGCGFRLSFMETMDKYHIVTAIIFTLIGLVLCFTGYKLYKDLMVVFVVLITIVMGFYLYMAYVEKSTIHDSKIWMFCLVLLVVVALFTAMIFFSNLVYFLLAFLISYKLGLIIHTALEKKFAFFLKDFTEYILVGVIFLVFALLYIKIHKYFIVFCTAPLGSSFIILSFHYYRISELDFLFTLEFNKFKDYQHLEKSYINFLVIFGLFTLIGAFCQIYFFLNKKKKEDMNIELNFRN